MFVSERERENRNKHTEKELYVKLVIYENYTVTYGQQNKIIQGVLL
jgi:hypothetical protein